MASILRLDTLQNVAGATVATLNTNGNLSLTNPLETSGINFTDGSDLYIPHYPHILTPNGRHNDFSISNTNTVTVNAGVQMVVLGRRYTLPATVQTIGANQCLRWSPSAGYSVADMSENVGYEMAQLFFYDSTYGRTVALANKVNLMAWKCFFISCVNVTKGGKGYWGNPQRYPSGDAAADNYFAGASAYQTGAGDSNTTDNQSDPDKNEDYEFYNWYNNSYAGTYTRVWTYWGRAPRMVIHSNNEGYGHSEADRDQFYQQTRYNSIRYIEGYDAWVVSLSSCMDLSSTVSATA